jgi:hypothetical protein
MSVNKKETLIRVSFLFRYRRVFCAYSSAVPTGAQLAVRNNFSAFNERE